MKYFEDFVVGQIEEVGEYSLTEQDIIDFSEKWDPAYFHTDPVEAEKSMFKGLIAAGVHLMSICTLILVTGEPRAYVFAGLGWDDVRFKAPGRPEDNLTVFRECLEARPSESKSDRGIIRNRITLKNQNDQLLLSFIDTILIAKRSPHKEII